MPVSVSVFGAGDLPPKLPPTSAKKSDSDRPELVALPQVVTTVYGYRVLLATLSVSYYATERLAPGSEFAPNEDGEFGLVVDGEWVPIIHGLSNAA